MTKNIFESLEKPSVFKKAIVVVFLICFIYWIYLIFASQFIVVFDALAYEKLGLKIYEKGWMEYLKTGPRREPLYPLTIAISMRIADMFSISYQIVQRIIQVIILFVAQILTLILLNKLKINNTIKLVAVLYFGFSPAIINSTFCLFSEIITYPFVLAVIIFGALSWWAIYNSSFIRIAILSIVTALLFATLAFGKAIFIYVFAFFLIPYFFIGVNSIIKAKKVIFSKSILYIVVAVLVFNSFIIQFKVMNKKFSGHFEFTNRYLGLLYGNAFKRADPITPKIFFAHLASIPGQGICRLFFSEDECWYTGFQPSEEYGYSTLSRISQSVTKEKIKSEMLNLIFNKIAEHPFQYVLFMNIEALRMPFWESTAGFVDFPHWLKRIFSFKPLNYVLRLLVSILTLFSIFHMATNVYKNRNYLFDYHLGNSESSIICFLIFLFIFSYTGLYSLFSILTRFAYPIVSLYVICIAYFLQHIFYKNHQIAK